MGEWANGRTGEWAIKNGGVVTGSPVLPLARSASSSPCQLPLKRVQFFFQYTEILCLRMMEDQRRD